MVCDTYHVSQKIRQPLASLYNSKSSPSFIATIPARTSSYRPLSAATISCSSFTWDDVVRVSQPDYLPDDSSDLRGYFEKIKICNRGSQKQSDFFPFIVEDQIVGYVHNGFANQLRGFHDVFVHSENNGSGYGSYMTLNSKLRTPDERTRAVGEVIKCLGEEELIPGMRNEPHGIACGKNLIKECEEEAGIPTSLSSGAIAVGAVSYMDIDGYSYKRDVLFCYDLKLPEDFVPQNQDGEVEGFQLIPVTQVANVIRRTKLFKPNCSLVIIDFLFRHGYIRPEFFGYLDLLQSLKSGDCS